MGNNNGSEDTRRITEMRGNTKGAVMDDEVNASPIRIMLYTGDKLEERLITLEEIEENIIFQDDLVEKQIWISIESYNDKQVERICNQFNVHHLVKEDIIEKGQRPKVEDHEDYIFTVATMVYYKNDSLLKKQLSFILGKNYLITFGEQDGDMLERVRHRLRKEGSLIRKEATDLLFYNILDSLSEGFFKALEIMGEKIDILEEKVISSKTSDHHIEIRELKKDLLFIHKYAWAIREVTATLSKEESDLLSDNTKFYFTDVNRQLVQVIDTIDTYRELITSLIEISLSNVSYRLNEVMKVLTILSTIFMPLSFITGIYGMNFRYMPETAARWGYPVVLGFMLILAMGMIYFFRKKKWF